jgi:hypothetical protein
MFCQTIHLPGYGLVLACSRGFSRRRPPLRCVVCNVPDTMATMKLCDGPGLRTGAICDTPVCGPGVAKVEILAK